MAIIVKIIHAPNHLAISERAKFSKSCY